MPKPHLRSRKPVDPADIWSPRDLIEMDAVVAACALVAQADGWVTPEERDRTVERMSWTPAIALFGPHEVIAAFETLVDRFEYFPAQGQAVAEAAVRRVRPDRRSARWLVDTACAVAMADGGLDGEERTAILRLCDLLDLDPADFSLVAKKEARHSTVRK